MKEAQDVHSTIPMPDINPAVLKTVLDWIYSDNLILEQENEVDMVELLEATERFDLFPMKILVQFKLIELLDKENVLTLLHAAELYKVSVL